MLFDKFKVVYHAQVIVCIVTNIKGFQSETGELLTFIAEPHQSSGQQITVLFVDEGTVLASRQTTGAVFFGKTFLLEVVFHRQIADAYATVHTAGGYKFLIHHINYTTHRGKKGGVPAFGCNYALYSSRLAPQISPGNRTNLTSSLIANVLLRETLLKILFLSSVSLLTLH